MKMSKIVYDSETGNTIIKLFTIIKKHNSTGVFNNKAILEFKSILQYDVYSKMVATTFVLYSYIA